MNTTTAATWNLKNGHGLIVAMPGIVIVVRGTYTYGHDDGFSMKTQKRAVETAELWGRSARAADRKALEAAIRFAWPKGACAPTER